MRVVVVAASGSSFCGGLDLDTNEVAKQALGLSHPGTALICPARQRLALIERIKQYQDSISALEACPVPVIAAVKGHCIGGGIDLITAADVRYCTRDARFSVKEADVAITADLGTLQRLPRIVGDGTARELALTARTFGGEEAKRIGLVRRPCIA